MHDQIVYAFPRRIELCCRRGILVMLLLLSCLLPGCGPKHPATVRVRGRVTYGGGTWPRSGQLVFTSVKPADGFPGRPGLAPFDTQGRFLVKTWENVEGLMPGMYHVSVECWKVQPTMGGPAAVSYVPAKFRSAATSGIELNIAPGDSSKELNFDVPAVKM